MSPTTASLARLATALTVATAVGTPAASAAPKDRPGGPTVDPASAAGPGNPGSIWLSGEGGTAPGHHPHLGCGDIVVWGAKLAGARGTYEIHSWPPTGARAVVATGTWATPARDGGSEVVAVVDGRALTDAAAAAGAPAHERQGRHFEITVAQEAGVKHKTFWVDCPAPAGTADGDTPQGPEAGAEAGTDVPAVQTAAAALATAPVTPADAAVIPAAAGAEADGGIVTDGAALVLGTRVTRPAALPLTGGNWAAIVATGMLLTGTGTLLVRRSRRAGDDDGIG